MNHYYFTEIVNDYDSKKKTKIRKEDSIIKRHHSIQKVVSNREKRVSDIYNFLCIQVLLNGRIFGICYFRKINVAFIL